MNFADDLSVVVRTTPLTGIDWEFLKRMDPVKLFDRIDHGFTRVMLDAYKASVSAGVSEEVAFGAVLLSHSDALRYVIDKAVKEKLNSMSILRNEIINAENKMKLLEAGVKDAEDKIKLIEKEREDLASKQGVEQFIAYLKYAAVKYANGPEKKVLSTIADRIRKKHIKEESPRPSA